MILAFLLNFCGIFLSGFCSIYFNSFGAIKTDRDQSITSLNVSMLIIGIIGSLMCILFIIVMECNLSSWKKRIENSQILGSSQQNSCSISSGFCDTTSQVYFIQNPPEYDLPPSYESCQKTCVVSTRAIQENVYF